jgi:hypothetical protein
MPKSQQVAQASAADTDRMKEKIDALIGVLNTLYLNLHQAAPQAGA